MARRIVWTEVAAKDLEQVAGYIAADSPRYAAALVREVRDAARSLADLAERGRIVPELIDASIRELFVQSYRLIYHVAPEAVTILGLIHGARELSALWSLENRRPADSDN